MTWQMFLEKKQKQKVAAASIFQEFCQQIVSIKAL
jgi:hypothetical protein